MRQDRIRESNQALGIATEKVEKHQCVVSGTAPAHNLLPAVNSVANPVPQTIIDATDRRHIEAKYDDKSRTTKETLDDIKLVHLKEKKKKEQNDIKQYQTVIGSERWVRILILQLTSLD